MARRCDQNGFTLVELVVTLVIIGALAAVSAPLFFDMGVFRSRGFFDQTISSVRYAQKLAVASGCTVRVEITAGGFNLLRAANAGACNTGPYATPVADPTNPGSAFSRSEPGGVALTAADFTFAPSGSASATVNVTVGARSFRVIAATGFVERL